MDLLRSSRSSSRGSSGRLAGELKLEVPSPPCLQRLGLLLRSVRAGLGRMRRCARHCNVAPLSQVVFTDRHVLFFPMLLNQCWRVHCPTGGLSATSIPISYFSCFVWKWHGRQEKQGQF